MRIGHLLFGSDREFEYRHGKPGPKIGEDKINTIYNRQDMGLYNVLPNSFVNLVMIFRLGINGVFDVHLLLNQQSFESTIRLKFYPKI